MKTPAAVMVALVLSAAALAVPVAEAAKGPSLEARIQAIEDRQAIERLLLEYGRALDSRDFTAYSQLFAANGSWSGSIGTFTGPAAIKAAMENVFKGPKPDPKLVTNFHLLTNARIDIDGDHAKSVSKWTFVRMSDNEPEPALAGEYLDTFVREGGQWKFMTRLAPAAGAPPANGVMKLTTQDYTEIEQLIARYPFGIDACSNAGNDYADLYTPDGEFAVSNQWGGGGTRTFVTTGREALARVAGGREGKCVDPKSSPGYGISHITVNNVITPTATGAAGKSYLLAIGIGKDPTQIERQGGYEDVYVKTPAGWKFKTRTHVWPEMRESVQ
ncbi:MAG TPA: nuclear transport factor 2 family protein, partial [Steroidobacteraceae bacterium]|nr:nuclear transport factor 2 family protein [Steroidobacteraceae bacterium]